MLRTSSNFGPHWVKFGAIHYYWFCQGSGLAIGDAGLGSQLTKSSVSMGAVPTPR